MTTARGTVLAIFADTGLTGAIDAELAASHTLRFFASVAELVAAAPERALALIAGAEAADQATVTSVAELRAALPDLEVIVLAAAPEAACFVEAERRRLIAQTVARPWRPGELRAAVTRAEANARRARLLRNLENRLAAVAVIDDITAAITGKSSYADIAAVVAERCSSLAGYDLAAVLITAPGSGSPALHIHCRQSCAEPLVRASRDRCVELARELSGRSIDENQLTVRLTGEPVTGDSDRTIGAQLHVPLTVDGHAEGLIFLCGEADSAGSDSNPELLHDLARRVSRFVRRLANSLDDERRRLANMVESMADGIILTNLKSDDVTINPAARAMLGIAADQLVTTSFLKDKLGFYPFDLVATRATTANPAPLREEVRIGDRRLHSIVSPVADKRGQLVGVVVALRDMAEAQQLARRQRDFVAVVSHELRTPLTSIAGALDILLSGYAGPLADKQSRYLNMARAACKTLNLIIDDILDVARSESGQMPMQLTRLALDELGREVAERYRQAADSKNITLRVTSDDRDIRIVGDPDRLTQVLNNLLSNAIKFTPLGGSIDVDIFGPSVAAEHVGVSVFNNGESILEDDRERVFEKFEQLEDSTTRKVGGTGLGLAISRAIIEAHRGRIWVESLSDGTKFVFTLPAAPPEELEDAPHADDATIAGELATSDASILLVAADDHATYILKGILMAAGYQVMLAADPASALRLARTRRPQLAVVDAASGDSDGFALVEIFSHDPDTRKTSVLVIGAAEDRDAALRAGADDLVARPIDPTGFRATCGRLIAEAGRARAPRILVVDDEAMIRTICADVLTNAGYNVHAVSDGAAALSEAQHFRPDLMLIDVMMPGLDGFATAERFRAESATSMTPIIFVSARSETADKVRAFRIGAEDYVVKPFDAAELVARVGKALVRHSRELAASPTTQLPGADAIENEIEFRLANATATHAFCYLDLDNLKAFNDYYGYAKADGVIRQTGDLIRQVIARDGSADDFIGHIAGDDFVFVTSAANVDRVCTSICTSFDRLIPLYYNRADREHGFIETEDRYKTMRRFPIMGVSIAAVTRTEHSMTNFSELSAAAAAGKTLAKSVIGSAYVRDGKIIIGERD